MRLQPWKLILPAIMLVASMNLGLIAAQTPRASDSQDAWWTAWSTCDVTPVQSGPTPQNISGLAEDIYWLQAETTNDSSINLIVWLWTGNRPLPVDGQYGSDGMFTKWLWAFSESMTDINANVTNEQGAKGEVQFGGAIMGSSTGPINGWPSYAVVPEAGCWTFAITATAADGSIFEGRVVFPAVP